MLPTILPCSYPLSGDYAAGPLGDHGDLWTVAWEVTEQGRYTVSMHAELPTLPLRLERRARVSGNVLRLEYELSTTCAETVLALWAAHPLFTCTEHTRVVLPDEVDGVLDVIEVRSRVPVPWPDGLDRVAGLPPATGRKLYVPPGQKVGSARASSMVTALHWR